MRFRFSALIGVLALSGCGAQVVGVATTIKPGPITAILVIQKPSKVIAAGSQKDFTDGLVQALQACHIRVATNQIYELSLADGGSDEAIAAALIRSEQPDAVLSFVPVRSVIGRSFNSTRFDTRLVEIRSKKIVWRGQAIVKSGLALGEANSQVGADLIHTMATSGVIQTCPPDDRSFH